MFTRCEYKHINKKIILTPKFSSIFSKQNFFLLFFKSIRQLSVQISHFFNKYFSHCDTQFRYYDAFFKWNSLVPKPKLLQGNERLKASTTTYGITAYILYCPVLVWYMLVGTAIAAMLGGVPSSSDFSSSILGTPGTSEESSFSIFLKHNSTIQRIKIHEWDLKQKSYQRRIWGYLYFSLFGKTFHDCRKLNLPVRGSSWKDFSTFMRVNYTFWFCRLICFCNGCYL